ncbi:MAG: hypothetical protein KatS3mg082_2332 [Nitrospiraceae bacterium]|nr:MAG: hypothetical protein KatS3mg082_2332 [Nitrospiraceae bacterium]
MRKAKTIALTVVVAAALVYVYYTEVKPVVIFGLRSDYAQAIPYQKVPEGLDSLRAESCGTCHREIYEEWKSSIHASAYRDPFFQAYWKKDRNIWVCLNCPHSVGESAADADQRHPARAGGEGGPGAEPSVRPRVSTGSRHVCRLSCPGRRHPGSVRRFCGASSDAIRSELSHHAGLLSFATTSYRGRRNIYRVGPCGGPMRSTRESISCRNGDTSVRVVTCRR